jgi:tetraacyldisaccharide 4'-kinase
MKSAVRSAWADEGWRGAVFGVVGVPFEVVYRAGVALHDQSYAWSLRSTVHVAVPVVSIGNVVVGGTGKTPVSAWLCAHLRSMGRSPALLTRGYGADEVALHRLWNATLPVIVNPDRVRAAQEARAAGADVVVLDDGFQHRRLARDLDVVLISAEQPEAWRMLPRGPYREPPSSLSRADVVVLTRRVASPEVAGAWREKLRYLAPEALHAELRLTPSGWVDLEGGRSEAPDGDVLAVCGIADPTSFARMVEREVGERVELMAFGDHHRYTPRDVHRIRSAAGPRAIVTTEKDAVKLRELGDGALDAVRVMEVRLEWEEGFTAFQERLEGILGGSPR